jgi:hypothetical protein
LLLDLELGLSWAGAVFGGSLCLGTPWTGGSVISLS